MKKKFKKLPITAIVLLLSLIMIIWGWFYLEDKVVSDSSNPFVLQINGGRDDSIYVKVELKATKSWINDEGSRIETVGAQYDGIISNGYSSDIENWKLVITMPTDSDINSSWNYKIDSSWNGTYTTEGNKIIWQPDSNTNVILAGESRSFGFIMISEELLNFSQFEFTGYRQTTYTQYPLFWILVTAAGLWLVGFLTYIIVSIRIRAYERRRENDAKIITQTMKTFAGMIDAKDPYTKGHSARVSQYAQELGRRMGMSKEEIRNLGYIGLMHDCGKIGVPDNVLTKPDKLSPEERKVIEEHTTRGGYVLENFTAIEGIRDGALYHHERYDGKGYPKGLKGADIPLCARIICVADAYDAMNSDRCYRPRIPREKIVKELDDNAGKQFDPDVVGHMIAMLREGLCDSNPSASSNN